ncbi:MAG TPA: ribonuclease HII [Patescibacteria group bacterium]|nr:ribonuclease HII [Patescibacteria group bacterium]
MLTLGIDDAGRGPVIGPMVLAGCLLDENAEKELKKLGVKDSKQLTQKRREFLVEEIKKRAELFEVVLAYPDEIDGKNYDGVNLNDLEAIKTAEIINKINKGFNKIKVIVDCPSVNIEKWRDLLKTKIDDLSNLDVICEHKADVNHVSVSAASVLAKIVREKEMAILKEKYGNEIGSGYCSDKKTYKFLEENVQKHRESGLFRQTWSTWKVACAKNEQKKLKEF